MKYLKGFLVYILAAIVATDLGVIFSSTGVANALTHAGADIGLGHRLSMIIYDLQHLAPLYGGFVAIALAIAFLAGALVYHFARFGRPIVYITAGAVAMFVMLMAMQHVFFGVPILGGARTGVGLFAQVIAGALGGLVFAWGTKRWAGFGATKKAAIERDLVSD